LRLWNIALLFSSCRTWELTAPWTGLQIKVPTKFIVGDQDIVYNIPGIKEYVHNGGFKKDVPYLQDIVVMEGVAHFINEEKAEEISAHIYEFINEFSSGEKDS
jgi:pimeloyl-ACP methyl ester carboxylesterase